MACVRAAVSAIRPPISTPVMPSPVKGNGSVSWRPPNQG
jgi:hypothetical protein